MRDQASLDLSVVLPAYQEEENLRLIIPRLQSTLTQTGLQYEIIVVDTATPMDKTELVCREPHIRYCNRQGGNNFGDAVRTGIEEAKGLHVLFMDADGSHTPEFIPSLLEFRDEFDVIVASRYVAGGHTENPSSLVWMSRILNMTYSLVLGLKCRDVSNSFKIYRSTQLKPIHLVCNNFDIIEEILFKLSRTFSDLKIKEVPFTFKKRLFGNTKRNLFKFILTFAKTLLRLRLMRIN